jgi:succinate dehydrogenase / fumarate reductase cytochrome b subunit
LGFHIHHGFQSAFQTLGWHHNKYNYIIRIFGKVLAIFISFGFATIPVVVYLFYEGVG